MAPPVSESLVEKGRIRKGSPLYNIFMHIVLPVISSMAYTKPALLPDLRGINKPKTVLLQNVYYYYYYYMFLLLSIFILSEFHNKSWTQPSSRAIWLAPFPCDKLSTSGFALCSNMRLMFNKSRHTSNIDDLGAIFQ